MIVFRLLSVRVGLALMIFMILPSHQGQAQFASASVLREGNWSKLGVLSAGLYKIDAPLLRQAGFDPATLNPQNLQLYGNGGGMRPQRNDAPRPDDLVQNAIFVEGAQDGRFDEQDYLLFYAQGPDVWRYEATSATFAHEKNLYSDTTFYFLTVGTSPGLRVGNQPDLLEPAPVVETFPDFFAHERDLVNVIRSGREWYGEAFGFQNEYNFNFTAEGLVPNSELVLTSKVMARSSQTSAFEVLVNGQLLGQISIAPVTNQTYDFKGRDAEAQFVFSANQLASSGQMALTLRYQDGGNNGNGYLNFLRFNFTRQLRLYGNQTVFRNHPAQIQARTRFLLAQTPANVRIWDISQAWAPLAQDFSVLNNQVAFTTATETPKTFVVFQGSDFPRPLALGRVANQNLHALSTPNLLIITPPFLLAEAERLANLRRQHDGLTVAVVTLPQVYHEFASGQADLTAIRDFVRMLYERAPQTLRYLLLFGDASYDYKDRTPNNFNLIPIYESRQSLHPIFSFSSDDYFGFMEAHEGEWNETSIGDHTLEIGVGRLPVRHLSEAKAVVDKLVRYATASEALGAWRNRVVFLADDGDNNIHQRDADQLAEILEANHPAVENEKLYIDAFEQEVLPSGEEVPQLRQRLEDIIEEGALIVNFTGHGAESGWTEEKVLESTQIPDWQNQYRMPLFVTATCEFGRYDDPSQLSGAELAILNPDGGGIALITTTRPVFASTNFLLNRAFYNTVIVPQNGEMPRLGDAMRLTKNNSLNGAINRNFSLLGDPSLRLAYPRYEATLTHLNGLPLSEEAPTLRALDQVEARGQIQTEDGAILSDFQGLVEVLVYDKRQIRQTLGKAAPVMNFEDRTSVLFRGKATVENGAFSFRFPVPKDIDYRVGAGKISLYAQEQAGSRDANGGFKGFEIGGSNNSVAADNTPPQIRLYLNDEDFEDGGLVGSDALLLAHVSDENGLTLSQAGLGHEMLLILDNDQHYVLNAYYQSDLDTYQSGQIRFWLRNLAPGPHQLTLQVWDTHNNSAQAHLNFVVAGKEEVLIQELYNFPNPVQTSTTFQFWHNQSAEALPVQLKIFDTQGNQVAQMEGLTQKGQNKATFTWNGVDSRGHRLTNGFYVYQVQMSSPVSGKVGRARGKLIVLH